MTVAAARMLHNGAVCFVGIGLPSTAANLARLTHAPDVGPDLRIRTDRRQARRSAALHRRRRSSRKPPTPWSPLPRFSATGCRADASTSAFLAPRRSIGSPTSTPPSSAITRSPSRACPARAALPKSPRRAQEVCIVLKQIAAHLRRKARLHHFRRSSRRRRRARSALGLPGKGPVAVITDLCILAPASRSRSELHGHAAFIPA